MKRLFLLVGIFSIVFSCDVTQAVNCNQNEAPPLQQVPGPLIQNRIIPGAAVVTPNQSITVPEVAIVAVVASLWAVLLYRTASKAHTLGLFKPLSGFFSTMAHYAYSDIRYGTIQLR